MVHPPPQQATGKDLHDLFLEVFALQAALAAVVDRVHADAGLSTSQHKVIRTLRDAGDATVPDIALRLGVSRQFVQKVCNDLSTRGLVDFSTNPRHKRSSLVSLTAAGSDTFETARRREDALIERLLPHIDAERAAGARDLLAGIREKIDAPPLGQTTKG